MRTLEALARGHQQGIGSLAYEVVVVRWAPQSGLGVIRL